MPPQTSSTVNKEVEDEKVLAGAPELNQLVPQSCCTIVLQRHWLADEIALKNSDSVLVLPEAESPFVFSARRWRKKSSDCSMAER